MLIITKCTNTQIYIFIITKCTNTKIYIYEQIKKQMNNNTKLMNNNTSYLQRLQRY